MSREEFDERLNAWMDANIAGFSGPIQTERFAGVGVLDWELSTLGHPLADFAYHAMMYRMPPDILGGIMGLDTAAAGLPDEAAYVHSYCRRTGRQSLGDLDYYVTFNMFRFAAILHGIRGRIMRGTAASAEAQTLASRFERVAELAWQQATRTSPSRSRAETAR